MKMNRFHVPSRCVPVLLNNDLGINLIRTFVLTLFLLMVKVDVGWGQCGKNIIQNPNFLLGPPCTLPNNNASSSLGGGCVDNWFCAPPNPHHAMPNPLSPHDKLCDNWNIPWQPYNGSEFTCIETHEGIFQNVSILQNPNLSFEFSIDVAGLQCEKNKIGNTMEIRVTKDLVNDMPLFSFYNNPKQTLITHTITNTNLTTLTVPFTVQANSGFNQIWIGNTFILGSNIIQGAFTFKNAVLTCNTNALTDITTSISGKQVGFGTTNNDNTCQFESFKWNFGDPASGIQNNTSTQPTPNHIFSSAGTYNVCVEVIDCHGCCGKKCEEVIITEPYCVAGSSCKNIGMPGGTVYLSSLISGPNPTIQSFVRGTSTAIPNQCFNLVGDLIIDIQDVRFLNTNWFCGPGSSIICNYFGPSGAVTFIDSRLEGCSSMWRGIRSIGNPNPFYFYTTGQLIFTNTTIMDAYRAIELSNGWRLTADESRFINNYVGCHYPFTNSHNQIFSYFYNCKFESTGGMKPAYSGQPSWTSRGYAGIEAFTVRGILVDGDEFTYGSIFKNLSHGILASRTGISIQNTHFEVTDAAANNYLSYGIKEDHPNDLTYLLNNRFSGDIDKCFYSTNGSLNNIQMYGNEFHVLSNFKLCRAIDVLSSENIFVDISNDNEFHIEGTNHAIFLSDLTYSSLKVDRNKFYDRTTNNGDIMNITSCTPLGGVYGLIRENEFEGILSEFDINLFNSTRLVLLENDFKNRGGRINQSNSSNNFYKGNVLAASATGTEFISSSLSRLSKYCCNSTSSNIKTFRFFNGGDMLYTLGGNNINNIRLQNSTNIGLQDSRGNVFASGSEARAWGDTQHSMPSGSQSYFDKIKFKVDPSQTGPRPSVIWPSQFANDWFPLNGAPNSCSNMSSCSSIQFDLPIIGEDTSQYAQFVLLPQEEANAMIANYFNNADIYDDPTYPHYRHVWESHYSMYSTVRNNPQIAWTEKISSQVNSPYYFDNLDQEMIAWYEIENTKKSLTSLTNDEHRWLATKIRNIKNIQLSIKNWYGQASEEASSDALTALYATLREEQEALQNWRVEKNALNHNILQNLTQQLTVFHTNHPFLAARKRIWELDTKRRLYGIASLSQSEWNEIANIANMCTVSFGSAVYEAYGLLVTKDESLVNHQFNEDCTTLLEPRSNQKHEASISLYPNPSTGIVEVVFGEESVDKILIVDILGNLIYEQNIFDGKSIILDLNHLSAGIYQYKLLKSGNFISAGNFILID